MNRKLNAKFAKIHGSHIGSDYPALTIFLWSVAALSVFWGIAKVANHIGSEAQIDNFFATFVQAIIIAFPTMIIIMLGYMLCNPDACLDIDRDGMNLFNKHTRQQSKEPIFIRWEEVKTARKSLFGLSTKVLLHDGTSMSTGHFPGLSSRLVSFVKNYEKDAVLVLT